MRLAASTADIDNLGSEYAAVEKVLGKRIRKRGRGRTTEYLVQFKGCSDRFTMWTAAQNLPQDAVGDLERVAAP